MTYRWSTLTPADTTAWSDLVNHLADIDGTEEYYSATDLAEDLTSPNLDAEHDTFAIWHGTQMVGVGLVWVSQNPDSEGRHRCFLNGGIHADHRGRGLGTELTHRLEARAQESVNGRHPGASFYWQVDGGRTGSGTEAFFTTQGYQVVRYFNLLAHTLDETATPAAAMTEAANDDEQHLAGGVTIRAVRPEDVGPVLATHRQAFADHWGSTPVTDEVWQRRWNSTSQRHEMSTVAVDEAGTVLSYVLGTQWVDRELYISTVGTLASHRGQGLAHACLTHTLRAAAASGRYDVVDLEVDSENHTGATRLYERLGFTHKFTATTMRKDGPGPV